MKEINQLIHFTSSIENLKSIIKNGFYTSYAKESFAEKSILIPMISFSNILYRDIGKNEVIDYGSYGIVFDRDSAIKKFDLNPVIYNRDNSLIENSIKQNFEYSILPQVLRIIKDVYSKTDIDKITEKISFTPIPEKIKQLIDDIDKNVNDKVIDDLVSIFEDIFKNSMYQLLLAKPYKVLNKQGVEKIAYNEREWRKSFWNLHFISEYTPDKQPNQKYQIQLSKAKPHYTNKYILNISISDIKCIIVSGINEIDEIKNFIAKEFKENDISKLKIDTLDNLKKEEMLSMA